MGLREFAEGVAHKAVDKVFERVEYPMPMPDVVAIVNMPGPIEYGGYVVGIIIAIAITLTIGPLLYGMLVMQ